MTNENVKNTFFTPRPNSP